MTDKPMGIPRALFLGMFAPHVLAASNRMQRVQNQAAAAGVTREFEILWRAEQYRARSMPGVCATPEEILQITVATYESP